MSLYDIFPVKEVSGDIVTFEDGADGIPMESLSAVISPVQDLHGYSSPWPAGGGKNKLNPLATYKGCSYNAAVGTTLNPVAADKSWQYAGDDTFTISNLGSWSQACLISDPLPLGKAYVKISNVIGAIRCSVYVCNGDFKVNRVLYNSNPVPEGDTIVVNTTFTNNDTYFVVYLSGNGADASIQYPYVYSGYTAATDSFSPYSNICPISGRTGVSVYVSPTQDPDDATTYSVDWTSQAGTVYGGALDVVTGLLTVTHAIIEYDGSSDEPWGVYSVPRFYINRADFTAPGNSVVADIKTNRLQVISKAKMGSTDYRFSASDSGSHQFMIRIDSSVNTVALLRTWLSNNPLQVVYKLTTPLTYQLTPQEVATLLGLNNVWADVAPVTVKYHSQTQSGGKQIDGLFVDSIDMQANGWFLKWRKLAAPKPKTNYVSVWGRDGDIDLTESGADGQVFYENRDLMMDMVYIGDDWTDAYSELLDNLHGKDCMVQFSSDPYWYWAGRIVASMYEHEPHSLEMSGIMFPYKLSISKTTASATVNGLIESNAVEVVLPSSRMRVSPKVTVTASSGNSVTLKWGTKTQTLSAGTYYVRGLKVGSEDVTIKVYGTGTVDFEYRKGML